MPEYINLDDFPNLTAPQRAALEQVIAERGDIPRYTYRGQVDAEAAPLKPHTNSYVDDISAHINDPAVLEAIGEDAGSRPLMFVGDAGTAAGAADYDSGSVGDASLSLEEKYDALKERPGFDGTSFEDFKSSQKYLYRMDMADILIRLEPDTMITIDQQQMGNGALVIVGDLTEPVPYERIDKTAHRTFTEVSTGKVMEDIPAWKVAELEPERAPIPTAADFDKPRATSADIDAQKQPDGFGAKAAGVLRKTGKPFGAVGGVVFSAAAGGVTALSGGTAEASATAAIEASPLSAGVAASEGRHIEARLRAIEEIPVLGLAYTELTRPLKRAFDEDVDPGLIEDAVSATYKLIFSSDEPPEVQQSDNVQRGGVSSSAVETREGVTLSNGETLSAEAAEQVATIADACALNYSPTDVASRDMAALSAPTVENVKTSSVECGI